MLEIMMSAGLAVVKGAAAAAETDNGTAGIAAGAAAAAEKPSGPDLVQQQPQQQKEAGMQEECRHLLWADSSMVNRSWGLCTRAK